MRFQSQFTYSLLSTLGVFSTGNFTGTKNSPVELLSSLCPMREKVNSKIREMEMELELGEYQVASTKAGGSSQEHVLAVRE